MRTIELSGKRPECQRRPIDHRLIEHRPFEQNESPKSIHQKTMCLQGKRILVVDDMLDNRTLESLVLKKEGAEVETACNGMEAVEKALSGDHDAILMDLHMPIVDGIAAAAELRRHGYQKPIIAITADCFHEIRARALSNGFNDLLLKPVIGRKLIQALAQILTPCVHLF